MKQFNIPTYYRSPVISRIKAVRKSNDLRKKDFSPSVLNLGNVEFIFARHFGFCYGVENAIEISYKALEENPGKRIFLLSQMIHNQEVNRDLEERGIKFLMSTEGKYYYPLELLTEDDIVIIPAFGTSIEMENNLKKLGIATEKYNTTCPFVEKVWNRSSKLGEDGYTIVIHGKERHEETIATFSHSSAAGPSIVIRDLNEAKILGEFITGDRPIGEFRNHFENRTSDGFDPERDLESIGVVNQTTMLATETQAIADHIKSAIGSKYKETENHFADTRDTLCYATNDNQQATYGLLESKADLAIVVGGYNSSNTSHLVELCEEKLPTYFINSVNEIKSKEIIQHFDVHAQKTVESSDYLPKKSKLRIILTSGASCPDAMVEAVMDRILEFFPDHTTIEEALTQFEEQS